ncbi:MAG: electron transfer flavoprotein subunit beta/FixA family protein [Candidatus Coatesbacteria bacterium]|nr:MAG: electron transfer flavoprotein subunit beta/FixA family protein [Candidatus Coatesbacteria bacterium]
MRILLCVKQTFDTEAKIKPTADGKSVEREGITLVLNPYDEYAVEEALRIKERLGDVETVALTVGPPSALEAIHSCYAMGVDEGAHVVGDDLISLDPYVTAELLAAAIAKLGDFEITFCGRSAVDDEAQAVPAYLAEKLGLPIITSVTKLDIDGGGGFVTAIRDVEGGKETLKVPFPVALTAQKGLNEPRYPSILGIRKAKKRDAQTFTPAELDVDLAPKAITTNVELPSKREAGRIIEGDAAEAAKELAEIISGDL